MARAQAFWRTGATALLQLLEALLHLQAVLERVLASATLPVELFVTLARFSTPPDAAELEAQAGLPDDDDDDARSDPDTVEEEGDDDSAWTTPLSSRTATQLLARLLGAAQARERDEHKQEGERKHEQLGGADHPLASRVLLEHIKPLFSQTPHKSLHPGTGRRLDRQRGGDQFSDTWLEAPWKGKGKSQGEGAGGSGGRPATTGRSEILSGAVGCWRVLQAAVAALDGKGGSVRDMERSWPLVVPPLLTLLDDHETYYRRQGVRALRLFLQRTPAVLLERTGLGELIQKVRASDASAMQCKL